MKKILSLFLLAALILSLSSFTFVQQQSERVIVLFNTSVDNEIIERVNGKIIRMFTNFPALVMTLPAYALRVLSLNPNILSIEQDILISVESQTQDWGIVRTDAPAAWESDYTGKGVKIAVVDTGIANHEDLVVEGGVSFTSYTSSYIDDNGHGTHVAGIIGARNNDLGTVGIAPESSLYAVKVLDKNGSGYLSNVAAGIDWAITNKMNIINLSISTSSSSTTLKRAVDSAYSKGILVVAAAGNSGTSSGSGDNVQYPARYDSVIAVSATDINDRRAYFSSTGSTVEVAAPGVNIVSTYLNNQYVKMSGTSMATPYTTGNLALIMQANPGLSAASLRIKLRESTVDLGSAGKDTWFGYGLIQAPEQTDDITDPPPVPDTSTPETSTVITTDKSTYTAGSRVYITTKVIDELGVAIQGATVKVTIKTPFGNSIGTTGITDVNGQLIVVYTTRRSSYKGTYNVSAETSYNMYIPSTATTTFTLK